MESKARVAIRFGLRALLLLALASATAVFAAGDAREIIRQTVAAEGRNWRSARNYGFSERVDSRRLDSQGRLKSRDVKIYDVMLLDGSPYRRLAGRYDLPLPPADEKKEQEKLLRSIADRRSETAAQRALRLAAYESRPDWQREAWHELPEAFDFRLINENTPDSMGFYMIEATPRHGYKPRSRTAKEFLHLRAKLWVDKQDHRLVRAEVEVIDPIWVGLFLVRLARGSHATFEQTRVNNNVWLPQRVHVILSARLGLVKVLHIEQEMIYSNRRESEADAFVSSRRKPETH